VKLYTYDYLIADVKEGIELSFNTKDELGIEVGDTFVRCNSGYVPILNDADMLLECGVTRNENSDNSEYFLTEVDTSHTFERLDGVLVLLNTFTTHNSRTGGWVSLGKEKPKPKVIAFGLSAPKNFSVCYLLVLPNSSSLKFNIQCETVVQTMYNDNGNIIIST
jgi:hypothetical protein